MRYLILFLILFTFNVYADVYTFTKNVNPAQLAKELETVGIDLLGEDQIGIMTTSEGKNITITTTQPIDETLLKSTINSHKPEDREKKLKGKKAKAKSKLKALGLTDEELEGLGL